jgi:hypothetical protein
MSVALKGHDRIARGKRNDAPGSRSSAQMNPERVHQPKSCRWQSLGCSPSGNKSLLLTIPRVETRSEPTRVSTLGSSVEAFQASYCYNHVGVSPGVIGRSLRGSPAGAVRVFAPPLQGLNLEFLDSLGGADPLSHRTTIESWTRMNAGIPGETVPAGQVEWLEGGTGV